MRLSTPHCLLLLSRQMDYGESRGWNWDTVSLFLRFPSHWNGGRFATEIRARARKCQAPSAAQIHQQQTPAAAPAISNNSPASTATSPAHLTPKLPSFLLLMSSVRDLPFSFTSLIHSLPSFLMIVLFLAFAFGTTEVVDFWVKAIATWVCLKITLELFS